MAEKIIGRLDGLYKDFSRKGGAVTKATHYCPGCGHGVIHKLIAEAMVDLGIEDRTIMISPVGCSVFAYYYFDCGNIQVAHGRAPAVATGISRAEDKSVIVSYQGDGDLASIGLNETMQAANRGEKIAVIFVNNSVYGMTGGQMAPTTLVGEVTSTTLDGRDSDATGFPLHMCEIVNTLDAPVYIERVSVSDISKIRRAKKAIYKALEIQRDAKGYAFVEILSPCPTVVSGNSKANTEFLNTLMEKEFPLGLLRDKSQDAKPFYREDSCFSKDKLDSLFSLSTYGNKDAQIDENFKDLEVKFSGFGGQGVLSMGLMLAKAGCVDGRFVSWYPSYGPEQRGGTSNCAVKISGRQLSTPVIDKTDILMATNRASLDKFAGDVRRGGIIIYDSVIGDYKMPRGVKAIGVPAVEIAKKFGSERAANTVMIGVLMAVGNTNLSDESFERAIEETFVAKPKLIPMNIKVLKEAYEWAKSQ